MIRRPRFGLRVCFLILAGVATLLGIHCYVKQSAIRQRSLVLRIEQENVGYDYGYSFVGGKHESQFDTKSEGTYFGKPNVPRVLLDHMGVDYFYEVRWVNVPPVDLWDAQRLEVSRTRVEGIIRDLDQLRGLEEVGLVTSEVNPDALNELAKLKRLRRVVIYDTTTAEHLEALAGTSMTDLTLNGWVSDEQLIAIGRATQLIELDMGLLSHQNSEFTKVGLDAICKLPNLRYLGICSHALSSEAIEQLSKLDSLRELRLRAPGVAGLHRAISGIPLRSLYVMDMNLSDRDLEAISQLKSLEELYIEDSTLTLTIPLSQLKMLVRSPSLRRIELNGVVLTVGELRELADTADKLELLAVTSPYISQTDLMELTKEYSPLEITGSFLPLPSP